LPAPEYKTNSTSPIDFVPEARLNFIHVSGTQLNKGLHIMMRVFKNLETESDINFIFIGKTRNIGQFGRVRIIELPRMSYSDLIQLYKLADFGLMPSLWFETAPLALHEMLENRVIPIISKSGGMEEIVDSCSYFKVEDPNDLNEWCQVIQDCCKMTSEQVEKSKDQNTIAYNNQRLSLEQWGMCWTELMQKMS
jgi:glycosyltransferase involved in cell wall biosynthesis